ncbi:HAAS domain-containing protein [Terribacillus saccharophilus]|uniref:HAAS domain-containing protein n=1 Tax=Terribacillus saccharophilus TaxID=361277 RepID=UPI00382E8E90
MTLSKESQTFLDNLRIYLFASNKKEDEVNELMEELEDHLYEAEQNGKNVEHIIGKSPKAYMKEIEAEVETDGRFWFIFVPLILLNAFAYLIMNKAIADERDYSMLALIGNPLVFIVTILLLFGMYRFIAANKLSKKVTVMLYIVMGFAPTAMFTGILVADLFIETPMLTISPVMNVAVIIAACIIFIAAALYWKAWISVIVPAVLYIPQVILHFININEQSKLIIILSIIIVFWLSIIIWQLRRLKKDN